MVLFSCDPSRMFFVSRSSGARAQYREPERAVRGASPAVCLLFQTPRTLSVKRMASIKLISAADTQYPGTLLKCLSEQRTLGLFCDVTIIVQDRKFRAHKNILSASSSYFHQLFSVAGQVIEINFIKPEIFEEILNYIYSSKIIRVRSDMLEELIKSGQTLGVKFIANLGLPLSQVKGIPGLSKDESQQDVGSGAASQEQGASGKNNSKNDQNAHDANVEIMPIITEAYSLSAEEFTQSESYDDNDNDSDSDDVIFCSEIVAPKSTLGSSANSVSEVIDLEAESQEENTSVENSNVAPVSNSSGLNEESNDNSDSDGKNNLPETVDDPKPVSATVSASSQLDSNSVVCPPKPASSDATANLSSPAGSSSWDSFCSPPSTPVPVTNSPIEAYPSPKEKENHEGSGVQKKQVTALLEKSPSRPGEFKIKLSDVGTGSTSAKTVPSNSPKNLLAGKTITLDKSAEIDALSTGCKVYANIGENTYDIVIPVKDDPGEGYSKDSDEKKAKMSSPDIPDSPGRKRVKVKHDDHYELIMDGKIYYICIVCRRSYVCLTSLRRHFNTHSWERKYPCRYCDKVFALAEYRTKHEIHHTGERRYQCLLCEEFFINYQVLSSHCKSIHNQDPSGKKEKDDAEIKLYRLLPCKSLQLRPYSYVSNPSGKIPVINDEGLVYQVPDSKPPANDNTQSQPLPATKQAVNWDDIFVHPGSQPPSYMHPPEGTSEFEFIIPETY
ncbi:transcriptional regulator Kaiso isoform X2 [Polypterus senegalus]|uniref:transcriptional regulator Kaiso isoform X2 n=1 Tax=Polypterus senegalus TaxID=55291 RepID=UPI001963B43E|nr:transcriptional regulator Kaiso isoform X2 [Polypterus senegalus]